MLEQVYKSDWIIRSLRQGPLAHHIDAFSEQLLKQGYSKVAMRNRFASCEVISANGFINGNMLLTSLANNKLRNLSDIAKGARQNF